MGYLGFKFDISEIKNIKLDSKEYSNDFIVILVKSNLVKKDRILILGNTTYLKQEKCDFLLLSSNFKFSKFLFIETPKIIYSKICVNDKTVIDFESLTIWLNVKKFKEIYYEFIIDNDEKIDEKYFKIKINNIFNLITNR